MNNQKGEVVIVVMVVIMVTAMTFGMFFRQGGHDHDRNGHTGKGTTDVCKPWRAS